jgi:hypothetical protein
MLKSPRLRTGLCAAGVALVLCCAPVLAQAQARVPDAEVKVLLDQVDKGFNRFVDGMKPEIRTAVLKSASGEIHIKAVLEQMKTAIERAKAQYKGPGGGAAGVATLLKDAKKFDAGIALRPGLSGDDAKWSDVTPVFGKLAQAYRIDWSADPAAWTAFRTSDDELKNSGAALKKTSETFAKAFKNAVNRDKALDKAAKQNITGQLTAFTTATKGVEELLKSGSDASAATTRALQAAADLETLMNNFSGKATVAPAWTSVNATLNNVAKAYGLGK